MADHLKFEAMSVDKLWNIYHDIREVLTAKISEQKQDLDNRLQSLGSEHKHNSYVASIDRRTPKKEIVARRSYPEVLPLYRNPAEPSETWSGRGNRPRWLGAQIAAGKDINEFRIKPVSSRPPTGASSARKKKTGRS